LAGDVDDELRKNPNQSSPLDPEGELERNSDVEKFFQKLMEKNEMRRPKPSPEAIAAALHAMQRLGIPDADADPDGVSHADNAASAMGAPCPMCGYSKQAGNHFCGMCGRSVRGDDTAGASNDEQPGIPANAPGPHHYHHHYHHHYFAGGEGGDLLSTAMGQRSAGPPAIKDPARARTQPGGPALSRTEAALRQMTQDWALACNNKQLDDLLEFYAADALVLRPNLPPVRGTTAIREFFFAALDSGLGDVEMEPLRVELLGDVAYEAGRCQMLVPIAVGKRREERGKYVVVFAKQKSGDWKAVLDSWSTDLTLTPGEPAPTKAAVPQPRR
jgi:ketosteroid isomerase-like protein